MAQPPLKKLAGFDPSSQSKTLLAEWPGKVAVLLDHGKTSVKKFSGSAAALQWCEANRAAFYYLPPQDVRGN
jgi:hypothetical protein